jgi:hypothetical protein
VVKLVERLRALDNDGALRLVGQLRPQLFAQVATLRVEHLKGGRELAAKSTDSYRDDARRVSAAGGDPRTLAGTKASFRKLRAACLWHAREQLRETLARADRARDRKEKGKGGELAALAVYHDELPAIEARLAFLRELAFDPAMANRREKTHQQRSKLGRLPDDWIARMHRRTRAGKYGEAVAVSTLIPVRPAEIAERVRVWIEVEDGREVLAFEVHGAKCRDEGAGVASHVRGIGQPARVVRLARVDESRQVVFDFLRDQVRSHGGQLVVGKGLTAAGIGSAFRAASAREFPTFTSPPSIYALRHEACAEVKACEGSSPQLVAKAMGHASERSQQAYGTRSQGSGGYAIEAEATRAVRPARPKAAPPSSPTPGAKAKGSPRGSPRPKGLR